VVPCYNEAAGLQWAYEELIKELSRYDVEVLFVDDGSTDGTLDLIKGFAESDTRVSYISFSRNFGLEAAFGAGFRYARKPWVAQVDADLQSPPFEIHRLLDRALEGGYDVVFGSRRNRQDPWFRRTASRVQHWVARRILGIDIPNGASTFRVVRTSIAKKIVDLRLGTPYFLASVAMVGARQTTIMTEHRPRRDGPSRFSLSRLSSHAVDLFFGFSLRPFALLHLFAALAGLATISFLMLGGIGMATPVPSLLVLLGLETLSLTGLAVVGRYVMGLCKQHRPFQYLVRDSNLPIAPEDLLHEKEESVRQLSLARGQA
jgi:glycosyltransferase involved in cell wall biosynthesis